MNYLLSAILLCSISYSMGKSLAKGYDRAPPPPPPGPIAPVPFVPEVFEPKPYSYAYEVIDPLGDTNFGHRESSDGAVVEGEYRVILPDGRTQIVTYTASDATGYVADVRYEGTIKPLPSVPRPVVVPAPEARRNGGGVASKSLRPRPIQKRKTQSLANQEQRNKRQQQQAKKQQQPQQQGSIQFQKDDGWTQVPTFGFQSQE